MNKEDAQKDLKRLGALRRQAQITQGADLRTKVAHTDKEKKYNRQKFKNWQKNYDEAMNFQDWFVLSEIKEDTNLNVWLEATGTRYSVEVNYRSQIDECLLAFAKIVLGYISAAIKQEGYHVKHVFEETPLRILISTRNWDDGEWIGVVSFNSDTNEFMISKGFYNKDIKTISIQSTVKCTGTSAAEITKEVQNLMFNLKNEKNRTQEKLKPVQLKRGPKG